MGIDYLNVGFTPSQLNPDFSLRSRVLALQTGALNQLLSDTVVSGSSTEIKVNKADQALTLAELYAALRNAIWSELKTGASIPGPRRNLQREYLRRIVTVLTRPSPTMPADARAQLRAEARQLSAQIKRGCAATAIATARRARTLPKPPGCWTRR